MLSQSSLAACSRLQRHILTGSSKWNFKKQIKNSAHKASKTESRDSTVKLEKVLLPLKKEEDKDNKLLLKRPSLRTKNNERHILATTYKTTII